MKRFIVLSLILSILVCCFAGCKQQVITIEQEVDVSDIDVSESSSENLSSDYQESPSDNTPTGNSGDGGSKNKDTVTEGGIEEPTASRPFRNPDDIDYTTSATSTNTTSEPVYSVNIGTQSKIDFKGATITIASYGQPLAPKENTKTYELETELIRQIEKKYNCKIEHYCIADSLQYYNAFCVQTMAGTKFADIAKLPGDQAFPNAALEGYVHCLEGKFDWDDDMFVKAYTNNVLRLKDKRYYLALQTDAIELAGNGIKYRKSVFRLRNFSTPKFLVQTDDWDWNRFRYLCDEMTFKKNGVQYYGLQSIPTMLFDSNNVKSIYRTINGKHVFNLTDPNAIECIQFAKSLYDSNYIPKNHALDLWNAGVVAMAPSAWYNIDDDDDVGFVYLPKGPNASDYVYKSGAMPLVVVPSRVKSSNLEGVCEIIKDYFGDYDWRPSIKEQLKPYAPDDASLEILVDIVERAKNGTSFNTYYPGIYRDIFWSAYNITGGADPERFVNSVKDKAQQEIDAVWEKYSQLP